ncbi:lipid II flippase MurJ [Streptacidiphilus sp. EB129]|uniref:lipid II flippase MurJ n=1 Tax=Streptacidiphilus sp. EB129 TaxID=3156262 RepID=UPI0035195203
MTLIEPRPAGGAEGAEGTDGAPARSGRGVLARAFGITALLSMGGSLLGLLRDLLLARYYGADQGTDAFLVSWTVPETAAPLLIEDAMAFLMVPAFSVALANRGSGPAPIVPAQAQAPAEAPAPSPSPEQSRAPGPMQGQGQAQVRGQGLVGVRTSTADPVRELVAATLPPLALLLSVLAAATALGAPLLVHLLAPGLADPGLAVVCTRLTAVTVLPFGLTGYLSAGLRAHQRFTGPAAVYIAYNTGILSVMVLLHGSLGVRAAAGGVALGSVLMTAVLLPPFGRRCSALTPRRRGRRRGGANLAISPMALLPIALFTLTRQSQVFVERYLASSLTPGTISHLNYAEKVAQMAMTLGVMVCTVTFPVVARALAEGDFEAARIRVEKDLGLIGAVVLAGTSVLLGCAPQLVDLLFQRGAFTTSDTAATAAVMRVYSLGLLGQAMVGALVRPFFSARPAVTFAGRAVRARSDWYPLASMALGLLLTAAVGTATAHSLGAPGLAAANAAGISVTAVLLLAGLRARGVPVRIHSVLLEQARLLAAAAVATLAATGAASTAGADPLPAVLLGGLAGPSAFLLAAAVLRAPSVLTPLAALAARVRPTRCTDDGRTDDGRTGRATDDGRRSDHGGGPDDCLDTDLEEGGRGR